MLSLSYIAGYENGAHTHNKKLLLWLLSKRPDIGELRIRDPEPMDYQPDLDYDELYADLSPDEQLSPPN